MDVRVCVTETYVPTEGLQAALPAYIMSTGGENPTITCVSSLSYILHVYGHIIRIVYAVVFNDCMLVVCFLTTHVSTLDFTIQLKTRNREEEYAGMLVGCKSADSQAIPFLSTNVTKEHGVRFKNNEMTCNGDTEVICTELFIPTTSRWKLVATTALHTTQHYRQ